jgi:uncharacterized membrane protein YesL
MIGGGSPQVDMVFRGIGMWVQLAGLLIVLLAIPAMVYRQQGVFSALRMGALLAIQNPAMMVWLSVSVGAVVVLVISVPVMFAVFSLAPIAVLQCCAYEMLARRYGAEADQGAQDYLERGWRGVVFPWKA